MFWGLIMEPNKRYTQTVEKSFHVSMASLDLSIADDNMVQVMLCYDGRNYLLCSLKKGMVWQVPLDLNFQEGTKIAFTCNGHGHVHLTGYLIPDEDIDLQELEEEDNNDVLELGDKLPKRKAASSPKQGKEVKRVKQETEAQFSDIEDESSTDKHSDNLDEDDIFVISEEGNFANSGEEDEDGNSEDNNECGAKDETEKRFAKVQWSERKNKYNVEQQKKKQDKQKLMNGKEIKQEEQLQNKRQKKNKREQQYELQNQQHDPKKRIAEGGVQVEDIKVGNGMPAKSGKFVTVYYVGRLKNGKKFDSATQGDGFKFRLGKGEVIKGWDIGIMGMKIGGKRRITIPPSLAYGAKGSPPVIPGNSTLIFEVELRNVH